MKRSILLNSLAGAGLLVFSLTASAQDRPRDDGSYHAIATRVFRTNIGAGICLRTCGRTWSMFGP
jgi:hypothetical protein